MPIYEYHCELCGESFDVRASFSEKEQGLQPVCPKCASQKTRQVISGVMVVRGGDSSGISAPSSSFCSPGSGQGCCG